MKKITSLFTIVAISSLAFGQNASIKKGTIHSKRNIAVMDHNISEKNTTAQKSGDRAVLWSDDFSVPANWVLSNTSSPSQDWEITTATAWPADLASTFTAFASPSGGNFALINSDIAGASAVQSCNITNASPINLSASPAVILKFYNYTKVFYDSMIVQVSNNGTTWVNYPVNTQYGYTNGASNYVTTPNPELVTVNITATAGAQATVWIRFHYHGAYDWFWAIDDVSIEDLPANDIAIESIFYGEYSRIPDGQQAPIDIFGAIANRGSAAQTNIVLNATVNNTLFTGNSTALASQPINQTDTVQITTQFTPGGVGSYSFAFAATQTETDANPGDNTTAGDTIKVTPNTFARDNYKYTGSGLWNGGPPFEMGNLFKMEANTKAVSVNFVLQGNTIVGSIVSVKLYDTSFVTVLASSNPYTILNSDIPSGLGYNPKSVTLPFTTPVVLTAGESYLAVVEFLNIAGSDTVVLAAGADVFHPAGTSYLYDPTAAAGQQWGWLSSTPMVRLYVDNNVNIGINEVNSSNGIKLFQNQPNPFNKTSVISYEIEKNADVALTIFDVTGKKVAEQNEGNQNAGKHSLNFNAEHLSAGVYYYSLTAGEKATSTMKMVVIK